MEQCWKRGIMRCNEGERGNRSWGFGGKKSRADRVGIGQRTLVCIVQARLCQEPPRPLYGIILSGDVVPLCEQSRNDPHCSVNNFPVFNLARPTPAEVTNACAHFSAFFPRGDG
jgi:hypothetical protein